MAGTYEVPLVGSSNESQEPKIKTFIESWNGKLNSSNQLEASGIAEGAKLGRWYKPLSIATEQTRENVAFGTLTTADEIKEVVLPENGLIVIGYRSIWKSSVSNAGRAAIFLGANQLKATGSTAPEVVEASASSGTSFSTLASSPTAGLTAASVGTSFVTTGQILANGSGTGLCVIFAAAGTYTVSVQYRATSGNVAVKERTLNVGVLGF